MVYNWQQEDWLDFKYKLQDLEETLYVFAQSQGEVEGVLKALPESIREDTILDFMTAEAIKTSEIEGEYLSRQDVISSIRNNLGLNKFPEKIKDKRAKGIARLMVSIRHDFEKMLSKELLFDWHLKLMHGNDNIKKGAWRSGDSPMQIISGAIGKTVVHFEAPPSNKIQVEMEQYIQWYNNTSPKSKSSILHAPIRSAIAHLYFETIHPFEDGNGRIGRAISEKVLSEHLGRPVLLSLSKVIEADKQSYYEALKVGQRSNEITPWILYFTSTILKAQEEAKEQIEFTLWKSQFFDKYSGKFNQRQEKVIAKMLEKGIDNFEGGMSAKKYMSITKTSKATATRDLQKLVEIGVFTSVGSGRSTKYKIKT